MKFTQVHRKSIHSEMKKQQFSPEDFEYVKRKGRINIIYISTKMSFTYFRKRETSIDPTTHQWVESEYFLVSYNSQKEFIAKTWKNVTENFSEWLQSIT